MFVRPLACAVLVVAAVAAQATTTDEGVMTIQTILPTETSGTLSSPLTNPLRSSESQTTVATEIPQLTFCDGVYTNTPCATASGFMSIPQGETPIPSSLLSTTPSSSSPAPTSAASPGSSSSRSPVTTRSATSSASGSVTSPTSSPAAAALLVKGDSFVWVAALSGLSATLGFAWTLL